jgi:hypothetical protein
MLDNPATAGAAPGAAARAAEKRRGRARRRPASGRALRRLGLAALPEAERGCARVPPVGHPFCEARRGRRSVHVQRWRCQLAPGTRARLHASHMSSRPAQAGRCRGPARVLAPVRGGGAGRERRRNGRARRRRRPGPRPAPPRRRPAGRAARRARGRPRADGRPAGRRALPRRALGGRRGGRGARSAGRAAPAAGRWARGRGEQARG